MERPLEATTRNKPHHPLYTAASEVGKPALYVTYGALIGACYKMIAERKNSLTLEHAELFTTLRCFNTKPGVIDPDCNDPNLLYPRLWIPYGATQGAIMVGSYLAISKLTDPIVSRIFSRIFPPKSLPTVKSKPWVSSINRTVCCLKNVTLTYFFCRVLDSTLNITFPILELKNFYLDELFNDVTAEVARLWSKLYP